MSLPRTSAVTVGKFSTSLSHPLTFLLLLLLFLLFFLFLFSLAFPSSSSFLPFSIQ